MDTKLVLLTIFLWITPTFPQPRIFTENGNLHISPALDKNLVIRCEDKSNFFVNDVNVLDSLKNITRKYEDRYESQQQLTNDIENVRSALHLLNSQMDVIANRTNSPSNREVATIQRRIRNLQNRIRSLTADIDIDECLLGPCKNGGTCIDLYKRYHCLCTGEWTGTTCETDVDECYGFAGTDLGCQNKADCINTPGSYRCHCKEGYNGVHCVQRSLQCTPDSCGHGFCVPDNSARGISCICDQGWKKAEGSPECSVDIDECETSNPCHTNCTNLPGSFECAACPPGYEGNGIFCRDINECESNNGGCNLSPKVQCINTEGSHHCGPCPPGWAGDGKYCTIADEDTCKSSSLCHPLAKCQYISNTAVCICPDHMIGTGFGPSGCKIDENHPCKDKPCQNNGTCIANGQNYTCLCKDDYYPPNCKRKDPCRPVNPCRNGGICVANPINQVLFTCSCPEEYFGLHCERTVGQCGGFVREQFGTIKYPFEGNYHPKIQCGWLFYLSSPKALNLTFSKFDLEPADSNGECKDFLQLHDGMNSQSQVLGRFCGSRIPENIITNDRVMYMFFSSNNNTEGSGFELTWNMTDFICGGTLTESSGFIESPGFPGKSPPKRDCKWKIEAPFGKRILFKFFNAEFENSLNCTADHLIIFDGKDSLQDSVIEKICSSSIPQPIHTVSHVAIISFHTDAYKSDSSFRLHYEMVDEEPDCGGLHSDPRGSFNIFSRSDCEFLIKVPEGLKISVTLENNDFRDQPFFCNFNYFDVIDGSSPEDPLLERYCLGYGKRTYRSSGNKILIRSTSKIALSRLTVVTYETECSNTFTESEGLITTPNYPGMYYKDIKCVYTVQTDTNTRIRLSFEDFDLPKNKTIDGSCPSEEDYLDVQLSSTNTRRYCMEQPTVLYSNNNHAKLIFHSGKFSSRGRGFRLNYRTENGSCGGVLNSDKGSIPFSPYKDTECEWIIQVKERHYIRLDLKLFWLSPTFHEAKPFLNIYSNDSYRGDRLLKSYTHGEDSGAETYFTDTLTIRFFGVPHTLSYETVDPKKKCGGNLTQPSGFIETPFFPSDYPSLLQCEWVIKAPAGHQIELKVLNFSLEDNYNCMDDGLEIRNGMTRDSPLIGRFCGTEIPKLIPSFTNHLYLRFVSDIALEGSGFQIEYEQTATGCGGKLDSFEGSIHSPYYPSVVSDSMQCDWYITVNHGSTIDFTITGNEALCTSDKLTLYDNQDFNQPLSLNCSNNKITARSESNVVHVQYLTTQKNKEENRPFLLEYKTNCNVVISKPFGIVESPNFPGDYPPNLNCQWKILSSRSSTINIVFSHLALEQSADSQMPDFVEIVDMKDNEEIKRTKYNKKPSLDITTSGNNAMVRFVSDFGLANSGFRLEFTREGCGGHLRSWSAELSSPNYPYSTYVDCEWFIESDPGNTIVLQIKELQIDTESSDCNSNALIVADNKKQENVLLKECKTEKTAMTITSTGSTLYVRFFTDEIRSRKNFNAYYYSRRADCGGILRGNKGSLRSPNYPLAYPNKIECEWSITIDVTFHLEFHFDKLDLPNNCTEASIEIRETFPNTVLKKICDHSDLETNKIRASSNTAKVIFKANVNSGNHTGFAMRYNKMCGKTEEFEGGNRYLRASAQDELCSWILTAKGEHARVTFMPLSIECDCGNLDKKKCAETKGITVYEGFATRASFCDSHPHQITSNGNTLRIVSRNVTFRGTYTSFENSCGGVLTSVTGSFASPLYPNSYPLNTECEWDIVAESGNFIELSFIKMDIVSSENCNTDYLEVRQGSRNGKLLGFFCSKEIPENMKIYERVWVKFKSGDSLTSGGFLINYRYAFENEITGKNKGSIISPNINSIRSKNEPFTWRIMVPFGNRISMLFKEYNNGLELYDGFDSDALKVEINVSPYDFTSSGSSVYLVADNSILEEFKIDWRMIPSDSLLEQNNCSYTKIVGSGARINLTTPGYPYGYENNMNCSWTFLPEDKSRHVVLEVYDVSLEFSEDCLGDYVKVMSSHNSISWHEEGKLCDNKTKTSFRTPVAFYDGAPNLKVDFYSDAYFNGTGMTSLVKTTCGSNLTDPIGQITVDFQNFTTKRVESDCIWHIELRPGKRIKFDFSFPDEAFSETSESCDTYALIKDGLDENAPYLGPGRLCKYQDTLKELITTSNRAYVQYHFRTSMNRRLENRHLDWTLTYEEYTDCGGEVRLTKYHSAENITTPNYPNIPNTNTECVWVIITEPGETIEVTFIEKFDLNFAKCSKEYVQLRDGSTELSKELGKYCRKPQGTIRSSSNVMYMRFFTNIPEPRNGFKAHFEIPKCRHEYKAQRGLITSKNYPNPGGYKPYTVCEYYFNYMYSQRVNLTFTDIDLPFNKSDLNGSDYLAIFNIFVNNGNRTEEEIVRITGNTSIEGLASIITDTQNAVVRFYTFKPSVEKKYRGFKFYFQRVYGACSRNEVGSSGELSMKNIKPYSCIWKITVPKGQRIKLVVDQMDLPNPDATLRLRFYDDFEMSVPLAAFEEKTAEKIAPISSSDNQMLIMINQTPNHRGRPTNFLKIGWTSDETSICPTFAEDESEGSLSLTTIPDNLKCTLSFKLTRNETLAYKVDELQVLRKGILRSLSYPDIGVKIGTVNLNTNMTSGLIPVTGQINKFIIMQRNNSDLQMVSFKGSFKRHPCGGIFTNADQTSLVLGKMKNANGTLNQNYGEIDCFWQVWTTAMLSNVTITPNVQLTGSCDEEYLKIYKGNSVRSPLIKTICGPNADIKPWNMSYTIQVSIHYHANQYQTRSNVEVVVGKSFNCGGKYKMPLQYSPYDVYKVSFGKKDYRNNLECVWDVTNSQNYNLEVTFSGRFFIETSPNCTKDYLEIRTIEGINEVTNSTRFCGRTLPSTLLSTSNKLQIVFRSDSNVVADGFSLAVRPKCGGVYNVTNKSPKTISYRNLPDDYSDNNPNFNCNFTFVTDTEQTIVVRFIPMFRPNFYLLNDCENRDYVKVYKRNQYSKAVELSGKHCIRSLPDQLYSQKTLTLEFSEGGRYSRIVKFVYYLESCNDVVRSPGWIRGPIGINTIDQCEWKIEAPQDHQIKLSFANFKVADMESCRYSSYGVHVYKGNDSHPSYRICGEFNETKTIKIPASTGTIINQAFNFLENQTFEVLVEFVKICDETVTLVAPGSKTLTRKFGNGTDNYECNYYVSAPEDYRIEVDFQEIKMLRGDYQCNETYIEVYEDFKEHQGLIQKLCKNEPLKIVSPENKTNILVKGNAVDFKISLNLVKSFCGSSDKVILLNDEKAFTIQLAKYPPNLYCKWTVKSVNYFDIIVDYLDLQNRSDVTGKCLDELSINSFAGSTIATIGDNIHRFCGNESGQTIHVEHDYSKVLSDGLYANAEIIFKSDSQTEGSGFNLRFIHSTACSREYTDISGKISMAPAKNSTCVDYIRVPENYTISLFTSNGFDMYNSKCNDNITVVDEKRNQKIVEKCDSDISENLPIFANTNRIRIERKNHLTQTLTYIASKEGLGCGGKLSLSKGSFSSPMFPVNDRVAQTCRWELSTSMGTVFQIQFHSFQMGSGAYCDNNFIKFLEVQPGGEEKEVRSYCGGQTPAGYTSSSNKVVVVFSKNQNFDGTGWLIDYTTESDVSNLYNIFTDKASVLRIERMKADS